MSPRRKRRVVGLVPHLLIACFVLTSATADAQRRKRRRKKPKKEEPVATVKEKKQKDGKLQTFDFTGLELGATLRTPQLLYFLDRASEELQRASLKRRSFVPAMVRSLDEEGL